MQLVDAIKRENYCNQTWLAALNDAYYTETAGEPILMHYNLAIKQRW